jgi:hypothetical protein
MPIIADDLIVQFEEAGIRRAVVFSVAYGFGNSNRAPAEHKYDKVKAENDRVAGEVARYPRSAARLLRRKPAQGLRGRQIRALRADAVEASRAQTASSCNGRNSHHERPAAVRAGDR